MLRYLKNSKTYILDSVANHLYTLIWLHGSLIYFSFLEKHILQIEKFN